MATKRALKKRPVRKRPAPKPIARPVPRVVRRTDVNGRVYFVHKESGRQRSRTAWELDVKRRKAQRTTAAEAREAERAFEREARRREKGAVREEHAAKKKPERAKKKPERPKRPTVQTEPAPAPPDVGHLPGDRPFPPGVSGTGLPKELFDDEAQIPWFEVDDENDYEEGSGT